MARKKYKAEEIIKHLRTVEIEKAKGSTQEEATRKVGVSAQTLIRWQKEYGGLDVDKVKRLNELEQENSRLKRLQRASRLPCRRANPQYSAMYRAAKHQEGVSTSAHR